VQARPIRNCKMQSEIPETDNYEQFVFFQIHWLLCFSHIRCVHDVVI